MRRDDIGFVAPMGDPPPHLVLGAREAHVHVLRSDVLADLSEAELLSRYGHLLSPRRMRQATPLLSSRISGENTSSPARSHAPCFHVMRVDRRNWRFAANRHGRPLHHESDDRNAARIQHLDHAGFHCLPCRGNTAGTGIDAEFKSRPTRYLEIADRFFSPSEAAALKLLPIAAQRDRSALCLLDFERGLSQGARRGD